MKPTLSTSSSSGIEIKSTEGWHSRLAESLRPYRVIAGSLLVGIITMTSIPELVRLVFPYGSVATTTTIGGSANCVIPDMCMQGFTPEEVSSWYESIGDKGRLVYAGIAIWDMVFLMPLYSLVLFLELYTVAKALLSPGFLAGALSSLPFVAGTLDLIETSTHLYGVIAVHATSFLPAPAEGWLGLVSLATRTKFLLLNVSVAAIAICWAVKLVLHREKPKTD